MQWFLASNGGQVLYRQSKIWILNSCTNIVWWRKQGVSISQSITRKMWTQGDCPHFHRGPQGFMTLEPIPRKSAHVFTIQKIIIIILYVHVNTKQCFTMVITPAEHHNKWHLLYLAIQYYTDYNKYTYVPCITHRKVTHSAMISATGLLTTSPANNATQVILYIARFLIDVLQVS